MPDWSSIGPAFAVLATVLLLALLALWCVVMSYMSKHFQAWQDRRFAAPRKRRRWGRLAGAALVWHSTVDSVKRRRHESRHGKPKQPSTSAER